MLPKNVGLFAAGDPFLSKLQEIDRDLGKFDNISGRNPRLYNVKECVMGREGAPQAHADVQDGPNPSNKLLKRSFQKKGVKTVPPLGPSTSVKPKIYEKSKYSQKSKLPKPVLLTQKIPRRWLLLSPAAHYELPQLELPGAWEPPASLRVIYFGESERT